MSSVLCSNGFYSNQNSFIFFIAYRKILKNVYKTCNIQFSKLLEPFCCVIFVKYWKKYVLHFVIIFKKMMSTLKNYNLKTVTSWTNLCTVIEIALVYLVFIRILHQYWITDSKVISVDYLIQTEMCQTKSRYTNWNEIGIIQAC